MLWVRERHGAELDHLAISMNSEPPAAHHALPASQTRPTHAPGAGGARRNQEKKSTNGEIDLKADTSVGGISKAHVMVMVATSAFKFPSKPALISSPWDRYPAG